MTSVLNVSPDLNKKLLNFIPFENNVFISNIKFIDKDIIYENSNDKLNKILNKYSKKGKIYIDKSPPQGTNKDSMNKIISERKN